MKTGLESQVTHGMAMKPSTCTKAEARVIFRWCRMQHMTLSPSFVFHVGVDGWKQVSWTYYRGTSGLIAVFFLVFHLASFEEAADCIPETRCEYPTSTHSYSSPFSHSCLQGGGQQSTSVRANPSSLVELHWGWIQLIALAWKDPKGGSYHISWLPPSASINSDSCTVSKFLGRKESALSPHAYYKGCFQQCATVISGAQLGNFNPPLSSLELLFMQPAFTQHNGCYLPMCFEGYC